MTFLKTNHFLWLKLAFGNSCWALFSWFVHNPFFFFFFFFFKQIMEDPSSAKFTWKIDNFSKINTKWVYSDVFYVGGYEWRILISPKGENLDHLSMYLIVADSSTLRNRGSIYVQFSLSIVNQIHSEYSVRKEVEHQFNERESYWGFNVLRIGELYNPAGGFLLNDTCIVEADVALLWVVDWSYDSKKETGFVGLKNQGATGYMNSLLQTLYHIPHFRKAMYHMPTTENDNPSRSITLALQSLFYRLENSDTSVATKELTKSFGWDTSDSFMLHDVQELKLNRFLYEKLENKMKGTVVEGTIQQLFEGHYMNYIECINVDYKLPRKESFRGVIFLDFPPILQLHLKRFEYDFVRDTMVKINDRYEFPLQLDLDREEGKYLSPNADRSIRNLYTLHSVLVHSGGVHGGDYYAYIRPTLSDQWFKFDDDRVTKEDKKRALEEQYGGETPPTSAGLNNARFKFRKYSSAYILVYIRESDKEKIICNVDEKDIGEHLRVRLKKQQEEKELKRKKKAEAHLYTIIKVARNGDILEQIGKNIYFDLVNHDKVPRFRIQKQIPFKLFKEEIAKEWGIPVHFQRFWLWAKRQNHTYRPNRPLTPFEEALSVGRLRKVFKKADNEELNLFLEVQFRLSPTPLEKTKAEILLFFKLYDPEKEELRYICWWLVKGTWKPVEVLTRLKEIAGLSADEQIELFEEIGFEPTVVCERIDNNITFSNSQLEDGDIICLQKSPQVGSSEQCRYPDVPAFLFAFCCEYARNLHLGLSTNGMNPLDLQSSSHSTWPVLLVNYNLPHPPPVHKAKVSHCFHKQKKAFNGETKHVRAPKPLSGAEVLDSLLGVEVRYGRNGDTRIIEAYFRGGKKDLFTGILLHTFELYYYFNSVCNKVVDPSKLQQLQDEVVVTLCLLEKIGGYYFNTPDHDSRSTTQNSVHHGLKLKTHVDQCIYKFSFHFLLLPQQDKEINVIRVQVLELAHPEHRQIIDLGNRNTLLRRQMLS
ncbi:hypothetical protein UlMin_041296 [Ulmus minor]